MTNSPVKHPWYHGAQGYFMRLAASGYVPAQWYLPNLPSPDVCAQKTGKLNIEVVSHCWNYAHFLAHQLSSLVHFPPQQAHITMTVYFCAEDEHTQKLLNFFAEQKIDNVTWNWRPLPRASLFRRAIGRNHAALNTQADWVWFTDCDVMFRENCLDSLVEALQGRNDPLVFPRIERCTSLLAEEDPMLCVDWDNLQVATIDASQFEEFPRSRATGPLQITHGDVARACGYCDSLAYYQRPSDVWCKALEDRAFRWLLRTPGKPIKVDGVYRIRHIFKGRYTGSDVNTGLRSWVRRLAAPWQKR